MGLYPGAGSSGNRHDPRWRTTALPVPQGERGQLGDRPGQISQLPPPSVSCKASVAADGLTYSRTGDGQQGDPVA